MSRLRVLLGPFAAIATQIDLLFPAGPGLDFSRASWDPIGVLVTVGERRFKSAVAVRQIEATMIVVAHHQRPPAVAKMPG